MGQPRELPGTSSAHWQKLTKLLQPIPKPSLTQKPSKWERNQKIAAVAFYIRDILWDDITRAVQNQAILSGLSLSLALIDYLGGYLHPERNHHDRYTGFINKYLGFYGDKCIQGRATNLYKDLRSAFFHNLVFTTPDDTSEEKPAHRRYVLMVYPNVTISTKDDWELFSATTFMQNIIDGAANYLIDVMVAKDSDAISQDFEKRFDRKDGEAAILFKRHYGPSYGPRYSSDYENPFFPKL